MAKPSITICSSAAFYRQAVDIKNQLEDQGYEVLLPDCALEMERTNDYEVSHYKTWWGDANDYHKKTALVRGHFNKVVAGDITLVLNFEKRGIENYIGGNVLMEMGLAFHHGKPIFVFNDMPEGLNYEEEILALAPAFLKGDLSKLTAHLEESSVAAGVA